MTRPPINPNQPEEGFYKVRLVKDGPWVPVRVWMVSGERDKLGRLVEDEVFGCEIGEREVDAWDNWVRVAKHRIDEAEYRYLVDLHAWARDYAPSAPEAKPTEAVDLNAMPPIF